MQKACDFFCHIRRGNAFDALFGASASHPLMILMASGRLQSQAPGRCNLSRVGLQGQNDQPVHDTPSSPIVILGSIFQIRSRQKNTVSWSRRCSHALSHVTPVKGGSSRTGGPSILYHRRKQPKFNAVSSSESVMDDASYSRDLEDSNFLNELASQAKKTQALLRNVPKYFKTVHWPAFSSIVRSVITTFLVVAVFITVLSSVDRFCAYMLARWGT